jgi:hypothetical protein
MLLTYTLLAAAAATVLSILLAAVVSFGPWPELWND